MFVEAIHVRKYRYQPVGGTAACSGILWTGELLDKLEITLAYNRVWAHLVYPPQSHRHQAQIHQRKYIPWYCSCFPFHPCLLAYPHSGPYP